MSECAAHSFTREFTPENESPLDPWVRRSRLARLGDRPSNYARSRCRSWFRLNHQFLTHVGTRDGQLVFRSIARRVLRPLNAPLFKGHIAVVLQVAEDEIPITGGGVPSRQIKPHPANYGREIRPRLLRRTRLLTGLVQLALQCRGLRVLRHQHLLLLLC